MNPRRLNFYGHFKRGRAWKRQREEILVALSTSARRSMSRRAQAAYVLGVLRQRADA